MKCCKGSGSRWLSGRTSDEGPILLLAFACARLDDFRDGYDLSFVTDVEVEDRVHHLVDHSVELVLRDIDAVEAAREIHILIAAQHIDLTDEAPQVVGGHPA
jgi:hypothetical protein